MGLTWRPFSGAQASLAVLDQVLHSWEGTPYMQNQAVRGVGVDCIRFIASVLDELTGQLGEYKTLPADTSLHSPESAYEVLQIFRDVYSPNRSIRDGCTQPGDVVVIGADNGAPGHGMIVGTEKNTMWHVTRGPGVHKTGFAIAKGYRVFDIFRMQERYRWFS